MGSYCPVLIAARPMIKHFNIMKDCSSCEYTGFKDLALDFLLRQASQKELDGRIIITIPPATSAGGQAMCLTQLIPFIAAAPPAPSNRDHSLLRGRATLRRAGDR